MLNYPMDEDRRRVLWQCRRTVLEMLNDRGYNVSFENIDIPFSEFCDTYPNIQMSSRPLERIYEKNGSTLLLHFLEDSKLSVKNVKPILEIAKQKSITDLLIIIRDSMSSQVSEELKDTKDVSAEVFKEADLMFNVTKHELVPKHRIMAREEKIKFLSLKKLKECDLPQILLTDPVIKYFKGKKGDLVEIERMSETSGTSYYYRIVV